MPSMRSRGSRPHTALATNRGFSMLEFMVALVVFTIGLTGIRSTQLVARELNNEALRFTQATVLANEMVSRIQANASGLAQYLDQGGSWTAGSDVSGAPPECESGSCSVPELARYDVWQWQASLSGAGMREEERSLPLLPGVYACIASREKLVVVGVGWRSAPDEAGANPPQCLPEGELAGSPASLTNPWNIVRVRAWMGQ